MKRTSFGQIAILVTLVLPLILTAVRAMTVWNASSDVPMSKHGWDRTRSRNIFASDRRPPHCLNVL